MLYYFKLKTAYSGLEFFEIHLRIFLKFFEIFLKKLFKNSAMSVWVEVRELKFCMNMLCYSDLDFFEIRLRVLLKNSAIFLKKSHQKNPSPSGLKLER
jgi:hypothetical protein